MFPYLRSTFLERSGGSLSEEPYHLTFLRSLCFSFVFSRPLDLIPFVPLYPSNNFHFPTSILRSQSLIPIWYSLKGNKTKESLLRHSIAWSRPPNQFPCFSANRHRYSLRARFHRSQLYSPGMALYELLFHFPSLRSSSVHLYSVRVGGLFYCII